MEGGSSLTGMMGEASVRVSREKTGEVGGGILSAIFSVGELVEFSSMLDP